MYPDERTKAAENAFERYEFPIEIEQTGNWSYDGWDEMTRKIYYDEDGDSKVVTFVVRFKDKDSTEVSEAYVSGW